MAPWPPFGSNLPLCVITEGGSSQFLLQRLLGPACPVSYLGSQGVSIWCRVSPEVLESWSKPFSDVRDDWRSFHGCYSTTAQRHSFPDARLFRGSRCPVFQRSLGLAWSIVSNQSWSPNILPINPFCLGDPVIFCLLKLCMYITLYSTLLWVIFFMVLCSNSLRERIWLSWPAIILGSSKEDSGSFAGVPGTSQKGVI